MDTFYYICVRTFDFIQENVLRNMALFLGSPEPNQSIDRTSMCETPILIDLIDENSVHNILTPIAADHSSKVNTPAISSAERRMKELEESEILAWQLMQEESMQAYELQVEYMRNNPELFSEEEMAALNTVLEENRAESQVISGSGHDEENVEEDDSSEWTYERLLELGQLVGG